MDVNVGDFDTLVELYSTVQTIGQQGEKIFTPTKYADVYAHVERDVQEGVGDYNLESVNSIKLTTWKVAALTTKWRVRIGSVDYEIESIDPVSRISKVFILTLHAIDG